MHRRLILLLCFLSSFITTRSGRMLMRILNGSAQLKKTRPSFYAETHEHKMYLNQIKQSHFLETA